MSASHILPVELIEKKKLGGELSESEITSFIEGIVRGDIPDYQTSAFLMATYFNGMSPDETMALTQAMVESGERYHLSEFGIARVDKHSTGGIGDKVSIILAPLAAACGLKVPMMAGRGLGHTGGTIDKLEAIPGYTTQLKPERFKEILKDVGCAIISQTSTIAPADKKLYALRDVTSTVDCIPLIVASILSKKVAEGTHGLVMDVKTGNGAFMKTPAEARALSKELIRVGKKLGLQVRALITTMDQPLGYAVGNCVEILECVEILTGKGIPLEGFENHCGSAELVHLTLELCAQMLVLGGVARTLGEGRKKAEQKLKDGSAWDKFLAMVRAQGGRIEAIGDVRSMPLSRKQAVWTAPRNGYITQFNSTRLGMLLVEMGGGRKKASDSVDAGVGWVFQKKLGARVKIGEPVVWSWLPEAASTSQVASWEKEFWASVEIRPQRKPVPKLIREVVLK